MKLNQIAANQTEIEYGNDKTVFFSYNTPVAVFITGKGGFATDKKFSATTSKHLTQCFKRWGCTRTEATQEQIEEMAK